MQPIGKFVISVFLVVIATTAYAANPREELKQLTAQLQKSPSDTALRVQIIKLALTIKPAVPGEAQRCLARAAAVMGAKTPKDYLDVG